MVIFQISDHCLSLNVVGKNGREWWENEWEKPGGHSKST